MIGSIPSELGKRKVYGSGCSSLFVMAFFLVASWPLESMAGDPLDDVDGTEGWDQVVAPKRTEPVKRQESLQQEIAQWESIRSTWESVREQYLREKAIQKSMALGMRKVPSTPLHIDDSNLNQVETEDWGDAPGEQWLVPSSAVDKAIDSEMNESRQNSPSSPAVSAPAPIVPPPMENQGSVPSAFKQEQNKDMGGGLAPGPADMSSPVPPPPPHADKAKKDADADAGAKAAAEMIRKQEQERKRKKAEAEAKKQAEAEAGEAAAARLIKMQQERKRKEQEELRKKAGVKVDEEGQVVDPDLQEEMNEDEPDSE